METVVYNVLWMLHRPQSLRAGICTPICTRPFLTLRWQQSEVVSVVWMFRRVLRERHGEGC
jgi:hypothetical protein